MNLMNGSETKYGLKALMKWNGINANQTQSMQADINEMSGNEWSNEARRERSLTFNSIAQFMPLR